MDDRIFHMFDEAPVPVAPYSHAVEVDSCCDINAEIMEK